MTQPHIQMCTCTVDSPQFNIDCQLPLFLSLSYLLSLSLSLSLSFSLSPPPPPSPSSLCSHCNSYTGSICSGYVRDDIDVYIDGKTINGNYSVLLNRAASMMFEIRGIHAAKTNNTSSNPDTLNKCKQLAEAVACHTVFPYCNPKDGSDHPTPRKICKSTCDAFRVGGICEGFINSKTSPSFLLKLMANCDTRENPAGESPECIPVTFEPARQRTGKLTQLCPLINSVRGWVVTWLPIVKLFETWW